MATFAKSSFNSAIYSATRPSYPTKLFDYIYAYHGGQWNHAVDLGCGTGQATKPIGRRFTRVTAVDPSRRMLSAAEEYLGGDDQRRPENEFTFVQGDAEDLSCILKTSTIDLAIAAQASHWFDWPKVWPEISRILKPKGTAAFWIYSEFRLPSYPSLTALITRYAQGPDSQTSLGPHFQRPGRTVLEDLLRSVPDPRTIPDCDFVDFKRVYFTGHHFDLQSQENGTVNQSVAGATWEHHPVIMARRMTWLQLLGYLRSWSALHSFHEKYPADLEQIDRRFPEDLDLQSSIIAEQVPAEHPTLGNDGGTEWVTSAVDAKDNTSLQEVGQLIEQFNPYQGDIAVRFWKDLREAVAKSDIPIPMPVPIKEQSGYGYGIMDYVDVEWPIVLLLARRRE